MSVLIKMAMPQNCYECRFMETVHRLDGRERYICIAHLNEITNLKERLETCPLEELQEQKHGRWKEGTTKQICSECLYRGYRSWHYCPNCGAKMEMSEE